MLIFFPLMFLATRLEDMPRSLRRHQLAAARRAAGRAALRLSRLQGPQPRPYPRAHRATAASRAADRRARGRRPVHPHDAARSRAPLSRRRPHLRHARCGSDATSAACRCSARSTTSPQVVERLSRRDDRPQRIIISTRGLDGGAVRRLLDIADELGIPLARLPRLTDFQETARRDPPHRADRDRGPAGPAADGARPRQA